MAGSDDLVKVRRVSIEWVEVFAKLPLSVCQIVLQAVGLCAAHHVYHQLRLVLFGISRLFACGARVS